MKKPNLGWVFLRFEIYQKKFKINQFSKLLGAASCLLMQLQNEARKFFSIVKSFHRFQPVKSAHDWSKVRWFWCSYEPQLLGKFERLKTVKPPLFHFAIKQWKKPFEYIVLQHQRTRFDFSKDFWKLVIFEFVLTNFKS